MYQLLSGPDSGSEARRDGLNQGVEGQAWRRAAIGQSQTMLVLNELMEKVLKRKWKEKARSCTIAGKISGKMDHTGTQDPLPSFEGSGYRELRAKCEQYFVLEKVTETQKSKLLLMAMKEKPLPDKGIILIHD